MSKVYTNAIEIIELNQDIIHIYMKEQNDFIKMNLEELKDGEAVRCLDYQEENQVLLEHELGTSRLYVYVFDQSIYVLKEDLSSMNVPTAAYPFNIENFTDLLTVNQIGLTRLGLFGVNDVFIASIDEFFNKDELVYTIDVGLNFLDIEEDKRFTLLAKVSYLQYHLVVTYDHLNSCIQIAKVLLNVLQEHPDISLQLMSKNKIQIELPSLGTSKIVNFSQIKKKSPKKIFKQTVAKEFKGEHLLSIIVINKSRYYIYLKKGGVYLGKSNIYNVTGHIPKLRVLSTKDAFYIYGRFTHYARNSDQKYDYLYIRNSEHRLTRFVRPFKNVKILKRYGFFKVPMAELDINERIHNNLYVGSEDRLLHSLKLKYKDQKVKTLTFKKRGDLLHVLRTNLKGNLTSTIVPFSEEYTLGSRLKVKLAKFMSKFTNGSKNTNLYFEKKSDKADESGFRVFEKVMEANPTGSDNFFILNKNSAHYPYMKKTYGKNVIEKYSYKHYLSIFNANYFISSELSNHLLNDRLYIDSLRNRIMQVPLVFLQHGIMFAKPVDNPMAFGFHKDKNLYNMYKSVISSELEAGEFYKMKYDRDDLILTGLATFDYAKLEPDADKIAFMPTYRYWEEGLVYNNRIEETSYYKTLMKVIKAFEQQDLLHRLLIVPHNKFSEFIYNNMPEYKHIISDNPSEALKISNVFITDYSSAIYDAQFRGAYPIFYWEEKDYLIRQYKAIPPVNDENAPGPIAYSVDDLLSIVKEAIDNDYVLDQIYTENYRRINEFDDRQNTTRILEFLKKEQII
ncbi:CDP-glycerol glycerophosphotransferase family protein [Rossellomorea marisflavi]|uniref:CDP-glycerol glycerophosphotransferase family protein n=1 Tax=Rossellomorea marisflavi TaxID=189381 RepID=UPI003D2EAF37